ncbi:MAG: DUF2834 domain-containing protein [Rhizorhabdus sp.]
MFALYLLLALIGTALPLSAFLPWFLEHGFNVQGFVAELFSTRIGAFFGWDVIVSAVVVILLIIVQGRRDGVHRCWIPIAATLAIGVSCGLPLFLALRERALQGERDGRL